MQTLPIVEDFDVFEHGRLRLLAGAKADLVDVLRLERGEEALHGRVIEAVAAAAHGLRADTIDMQNPLGDQRFALSAKAAAILFLGRRHPNHRANAWFPPLVSHQGADQRLTIDAISLHPAMPTRHGD